MAKKEKNIARGESPGVRNANRVSILDFARKQGFEILDIDERTATIYGDEEIIIDKANNA